MKQLLSILLFFLVQNLFAQIVNPIPGTWSNKQLLVLDLSEESSAYYSLSDSDPEKSGFAYDGPVLIDLDGQVTVRVSIVDKKGNSIQKKISYFVQPVELPKEQESQTFVQNIIKNGIIEYSAGSKYKIPSSLEYSLGSGTAVYTQGIELSLSSDMILSRAIPCTVTDGNGFWRFIIMVSPVKAGLFSRKDVPFDIIDWETFVFKDKNYIYQIDDEWWTQPKKNVTLDRAIPHKISWQSVNYSKENIIKSYVVPPKPSINKVVEESGEVSVSFSGAEGYSFGVLDKENNTRELYESINIDTFSGDNFDGSLKVGIFYDYVYQSSIDLDFSIHKRLPLPPFFESTSKDVYARNPVRVLVMSPEKELSVYTAVSGPVIIDEHYVLKKEDILFDLTKAVYKKNYGQPIVLSPVSDGAAAYKVSAYCVDEHKNKSKVSEYTVIIDQINYYIDGTITDSEKIKLANGTKNFPFTDFAQVLALINNSRFVHIRLQGDVKLPEGTTVISSNCRIDGEHDARLILSPSSNFIIRNSSVSFANCLITLSESQNVSDSAFLFNLERGVIYFDGVELSAVFGKSGTVMNSDNSVINITNSGITSSANTYTSSIAAVDSKISIKNSRFTSVAGTAVNFSAQGGIFELTDTTCIVTGVMGRVAELFDTHSTVTRNNFAGDLKKAQGNNKPIYTDDKNYSVEYSQNNISGF